MQKARGRGRGLVLVVDDDPLIQQVVHDCLDAEGYRVAHATTFAEAVDALTHTRFDVILADVLGSATAASADQWTILDEISARAGYTPVVIFTAHSEREMADWAARGFRDLLCKPFDLDDLVSTVERHIAGASP